MSHIISPGDLVAIAIGEWKDAAPERTVYVRRVLAIAVPDLADEVTQASYFIDGCNWVPADEIEDDYQSITHALVPTAHIYGTLLAMASELWDCSLRYTDPWLTPHQRHALLTMIEGRLAYPPPLADAQT